MTEREMNLAYLLQEARKVTMTQAEIAEQRRSFAYGNAVIENARITKEMIAREDGRLALAAN